MTTRTARRFARRAWRTVCARLAPTPGTHRRRQSPRCRCHCRSMLQESRQGSDSRLAARLVSRQKRSRSCFFAVNRVRTGDSTWQQPQISSNSAFLWTFYLLSVFGKKKESNSVEELAGKSLTLNDLSLWCVIRKIYIADCCSPDRTEVVFSNSDPRHCDF